MKHLFSFSVPVQPTPKARHRTRVIQGNGKAVAVMYSPKKNTDYERRVLGEAIKAAGGELKKTNLPLGVCIDFVFEIPKSWRKKQKEEAKEKVIYHTSRPDVDNLAKAILDALNGHLFEDDSQVCECHTKKYYGEKPCVVVSLFVLNSEDDPR